MEMAFLPASLPDNSLKIKCSEILNSRIRPLVCHEQVSAGSLHLGDQICMPQVFFGQWTVIIHLHSVDIN